MGENEEQIKKISENEPYHPFCPSCCDLRFRLYTVWTALDYFDSPFDTGSGTMLFAIGSHSKYKGIYDATLNNKAVPTGYSKKTLSEKSSLRWAYVDNIKPGDMFIFDCKTLHTMTASKDGFLRARMDMRVSIKPSQQRYIKQMNDMKKNERHLGLSQLCSQPITNSQRQSPELNKPAIRYLQNENKTVHDALDLNIDDDDDMIKDVTKVNIGDLPTQMTQIENNDNMQKQQQTKKKSITPIDISEDDLIQIPETPKQPKHDLFRSVHTPQSVPSIQSSPIKQKSVEQQMANYIAPTQSIQYSQASKSRNEQQIIQQQQPKQSLPMLEQQSPHNLRQSEQYRMNNRKRTYSNIDSMSQEKEKEIDRRMNMEQQQSPNKRQKVSSHINSNNSGYQQERVPVFKYKQEILSSIQQNQSRGFQTMSDEELGRKINTMRNKMNRTMQTLTSQCNEALDLMEVANERYKYMKQQQQQERDRANQFQGKVENLQKAMIANHNLLFKMFEDQ